jgi:trehalose 6-phosphate synthase/phosphatase
VEVRCQGVNKGLVVDRVLRAGPAGRLVVAMGDDRTDEDLFAALPDGAITLHVGPGQSRAAYRLADPYAARSFLRALVEQGQPER